MESNQLFITVADSLGWTLLATALWNPSSQRNDHPKRVLEGVNENISLGFDPKNK